MEVIDAAIMMKGESVMLDNLFQGIFDTAQTQTIAPGEFLIIIASSLAVGLILAAAYMYKSLYNKGFVATLALLPAVVCVIIMMVNGNIGTGVAVMGAFNLVRFRSVPGSAKEICAIFLAMATGLVMGMGYIAYGFLCAVILGLVSLIYGSTDFGAQKRNAMHRILYITVPEDLDYTGVFDTVLSQYASKSELTGVKTTNMGSLFKLTYNITLCDADKEKDLIDELRCRNGNLEINIIRQTTGGDL